MTPKLCKHGLPNLTEYTCRKCMMEAVNEVEGKLNELCNRLERIKNG